ncbi:hypothetical protein [Dokdonia sp.]|uniref:hypothetical protein n=1 Tax=Dokdonia sp. TaxID=2024995 RepID=UPI003264266D
MNYKLPINIYSNKKSILQEDYIFICRRSDGFNRRLLKIDLLINKEFEYEMKMESLEYQNSTGKKLCFFLSGNIPINIQEPLEYLLSLKKLDTLISHSYGKYMTDIGDNDYIFINKKNVINTSIHILDYETFSKKANSAESELINLHDSLRVWVENIYEKMKSV